MRLLFLLLFPFSLFALYNGSPNLPAMPEYGFFIPKTFPLGIKGGYEMDWTYGSNFHTSSLENLHDEGYGYSSLAQLGVFTLNFVDRVEVFGLAGSFSFQWDQERRGGGHISYEVDPSFAWGVGGRALLAYWEDLHLSINASYLDCSPSSVRVAADTQRDWSSDIHFNAWQVGGGFSYQFAWFVPYVGVDYLNETIETGHFSSPLLPEKGFTFTLKDPFGIYLGLGICVQKGWNLNIEARFINEESLSVSADIKF